jgi:hypothetical protein
MFCQIVDFISGSVASLVLDDSYLSKMMNKEMQVPPMVKKY